MCFLITSNNDKSHNMNIKNNEMKELLNYYFINDISLYEYGKCIFEFYIL